MKARGAPFALALAVVSGCGAIVGLGDVPRVHAPEADGAPSGDVRDARDADDSDANEIEAWDGSAIDGAMDSGSNDERADTAVDSPQDQTVASDGSADDSLDQAAASANGDTGTSVDGDADTDGEAAPQGDADNDGELAAVAADADSSATADDQPVQDAPPTETNGEPGEQEETFANVEYRGGMFTGGPVVASWGAGRLDVFAVGVDQALYHTAFDGSSGWQN
jgi:hypothetical protein